MRSKPLIVNENGEGGLVAKKKVEKKLEETLFF